MEILDTLKQSFSDIAPQAGDIFKQIFGAIINSIRFFFSWMHSNPSSVGAVYAQIVRFVMPFLALYILFSVLRRMLRVKNPVETWGYLISEELGRFPVDHWECTIGRARHCDVRIKFATISNTQCAITRDEKGDWYLHDLSGHDTTYVNDTPVPAQPSLNEGWLSLIAQTKNEGIFKTLKSLILPGSEADERVPVKHGDTISIGGIRFRFESITRQEYEVQKIKRSVKSKPVTPWSSFIALTVFQFLTMTEFLIARPDSRVSVLMGFSILCVAMWIYTASTWMMGQRGFEPEILAFFACTLNLAVTATSVPQNMLKQSLSIVLGMVIFMFLGWYLRDLKRAIKTRHAMAAIAVMLFSINAVFGQVLWGARNWISIAGISLQPSELAKICFIFAGAATLDRLFVKKNLFLFMCLSGFCLLALAVMGDFGTAAIFFVVFLVIAFMRSGDFATLSLISGAAAGAILLVLRFKPYVANRFSIWGHAWEDPNNMGYQQVRTMSASASGGLIGVGGGNGWLHNVAASNTDLVFGILCEEWGLIIALLSVSIIIVLTFFAFRVTRNGRSAYYTIAACAVSSLFVFQTMLNVFGSVDILPLTGVTFPFISCGGSSMLSAWGLLSFIKAADTRQNASFAVKSMAMLGDVPDNPLDALAIKKQQDDFEVIRELESSEPDDYDDDFAIFRELENEFSESDSSGDFDVFDRLKNMKIRDDDDDGWR